ncbi:MAG: endopeptidase La [Oscillospiraceae bacterium]|nr:endopeptidase La [Oscillospiraceae bacterium]
MKNNTSKLAIKNKLNIMPLVGYVLYPGQQIYLECHGEAQIAILEEVMEKENKIFLATQKEVVGAPNGEILQENLFSVGIIAEIKHLQKKGKGAAKILVEGVERASLINLTNENGVFFADIQKYPNSKIEQKETQETEEDKDFRKALVRTLKRLFTTYTRFVPQISGNVVKTVKSLEEPDKLVDYISSHVMLDVQVKQRLLELTNTIDRMVMLSNSLEEEISVINYEIEINEKLRGKVDKNQREYYIREQINVLQSELGEGESKDEEVKYYLESIENVLGPGFAQEKEHLKKEVKRLNKLPSGSQEVAVIKSYLDICLELPWQKSSVEQIDILKAEEALNKNHFGLNKVKEQILETIAIKAHSPKTKWQVLCLVGPPGVGKTSIAKAIAEALNRKYVQISLGGLRDEAEVRGHRKTYVGAMPGRIINALRTAKENNPVILLDEIDKMANDARSDPTAAFLEVLDYEQNKNFKDNYIEIPFDLSNVLFITTANYAGNIPLPLYDRMEIIELGSYTRLEKFEIVKRYIIPKQLAEYNQSGKQIKFKDEAIYKIIDGYTREAGVRAAARIVSRLCRKAAKTLLQTGKNSITFTGRNLGKYLGNPQFLEPDVLKKNEVGVVTGLAWTQVGGETMCLEALALSGTGKLELTGSLGDVMKESAHAALSYIRKVSKQLKIAEDFYQNNDIHLHVPEGAVPKDGPSAGTAISTAIVSELIKKPIKNSVAITGEITLRGKVLPVGGIKEKVLAAHRVGIKTVILPKGNERDLEEIDNNIKKDLNFILAEDVDTVWKKAIVGF